MNVSAVARRHGIKPSLLFRWRNWRRKEAKPEAAPAFLPVSLAAPAKNGETSWDRRASEASPPTAASRSRAATEDELAAEKAAARTQGAPSSTRKRPSRKPFPAHLPRERVVIPAPACCPCCGSSKLSKLGEDVTETLEVVPRRWKVVQTVREKLKSRLCDLVGLGYISNFDQVK